MKFPKAFNKWSNEHQREWIANRLKIVREEEDVLLKLNRLLIGDKNFTPRVDEYGTLDYQMPDK